VDEISVLGRNTQGVRLIRLAEGERLTGIERIEHLEGVVEEAGDSSVGEGTPGETPAADAASGDTPPEGVPESEN
jgi:DNA gyrase subunit A